MSKQVPDLTIDGRVVLRHELEKLIAQLKPGQAISIGRDLRNNRTNFFITDLPF